MDPDWIGLDKILEWLKIVPISSEWIDIRI